MHLDLRSLFPLEPTYPYALDSFVGCALFAGGVWKSARTSDGFEFLNAIEYSPERLRFAGRIYEIADQSVHPFWLEIECTPNGSAATWKLYFDPITSSPRRAYNAIHVLERSEDIEWRVALAGAAEVRDGQFSPPRPALVVTSAKRSSPITGSGR